MANIIKSMVDRAVAIWQALWPNSWVETRQALTGTFTIAQGDSEGPQSRKLDESKS
jgi:hypothetical protein